MANTIVRLSMVTAALLGASGLQCGQSDNAAPSTSGASGAMTSSSNGGASSGSSTGATSSAGGSPGSAGSGGSGGSGDTAGSSGSTGSGGGGAGAGGSGAGGSIADAGPLQDRTGPRPDAAPPPLLTFRPEGGSNPMNAVWGTSATDIYAAGSGTIVHSTGDGAWMHQNPATTARFTGIWGSGPQDIYISAFSNLILHTVGDGKWEHTVFAAGRTYEDVWGSGPGDVYAVSGGATRFKNGTWVEPTERVSTDGEPLRALWGSSASDVYIAGSGGSVFHSIGDGKWQKQVTGATNLQDITGNGKGDVYALSVTSVFHSIGNGVWTPQPVPALLDGGTPEGMRCIWALDSTAVYVGTSEGRLFRSGGSGSWVAQTIDPAKNGLTVYGIWGTGTSNLYVATTAGIYHGSAP